MTLEQERETRLEMLVGHMADVLAELQSATNELRAHEKHVRLQSQIDFIKDVVYLLAASHRALAEDVERLHTDLKLGRRLL